MRLNEIEKKIEKYEPVIMETSMECSVLLPLVEHEGKLHILFELRSAKLNRQPGEVCFPGGAKETSESPEACARRETAEELGISPQDIRIFGQFDTLHNYTNMTIYTFVGTLSEKAMKLLSFGKDGVGRYIANPQEVAELFLVPVSFFEDTEPYVYHYRVKPEIGTDFPYEMIDSREKYQWRQGRCTVPIFHYRQRVIWGISARILCNFMEKMKNGKI